MFLNKWKSIWYNINWYFFLIFFKWILLYKIIYITNIIKTLNHIQIKIKLFEPYPNPTQVELQFKKLNPSPMWLLNIIIQTHSNIE